MARELRFGGLGVRGLPSRMPLRLLVVILVALVATASPAAAATPAPITLDQGWEFKADPHNQGLTAGYKDGAWQDAWSPIAMPHVFQPQPTDSLFGGTIGWYRLRFEAPEAPHAWTWALHFEGVRRVSRVWLNGKYLGSNGNPYSQFTKAAKSLRPGVNELVVRVHNVKPAEIREGWWNWGGIVRPVHLEPVGPAHWDDVGLLSDVECGTKVCEAIVRADGWLENNTDRVMDPLLTVNLVSPNGDATQKTVKVNQLRPGERRRVDFATKIAGKPLLWSPKHPSLYTGFIEVKENGVVYQRDERRTGLRYIRVEDGNLYLNGHRLQLRGASIQEDLPGRGPAIRPQDAETIIADLKALKANVTRAQYPLNEYILDRLDEEGILVWSQAPVYHEDDSLARDSGRAHAYRKVRGTILYARNHPSVMTHSVANELSVHADSKPGTRRFMRRASRIAHDLDHTVPISLDILSYPGIPRQKVYSVFDLLGINSYYGWYRGNAGAKRSTADFRKLRPFLRSMKRKYPDLAMMLTEFGAEATYEGPAHVKETYAFQTNYLRKTLKVVEDFDWLSGAIYWTAREFYVKPNWDGGAERTDVVRDAIHNKGLLHYDGTPKPAFRVARRLFETTPIYDTTPPASESRRKKRRERSR